MHSHLSDPAQKRFPSRHQNFILCVGSITLPAAVGVLAKETAVMLPLYAFLVELFLFHFQRPADSLETGLRETDGIKTWLKRHRDARIIGLFVLTLALPMLAGMAWLLPGLLKPDAWATRDFSLITRLLSEARIVIDYIVWTLLPTRHALSFYHDDFQVSRGLLQPWTTLASIALLIALITLTVRLRHRQPLAALGIALYLGSQLLTGTILPLELIYEHRNYFPSFGLLLALVPMLATPSYPVIGNTSAAMTPGQFSVSPTLNAAVEVAPTFARGLPMMLPRFVLLTGLILYWAAFTALTAYAWGNPLRLAEDLASRAPQSPRAQYELGRTYIIYSRYDPASPFTRLAYAPLERSAALPDSSILAEQALIFMNAHMHLALKDAWWDSLIAKLKAHKPGVQDESSLGALTQCAREHRCALPNNRMTSAYIAALSHPDPSARLLAMYGDYAWNVLDDHPLGLRMDTAAVAKAPSEPAYRVTQVRMLVSLGHPDEAHTVLEELQSLNIGGRLDTQLAELRKLPGMQ